MWYLPSLLRVQISSNNGICLGANINKFDQMWYLLHICTNFAVVVNPFFSCSAANTLATDSLEQATPNLTFQIVLSQRVKHGERVKPSYTSLLDSRNDFSGSRQGIGQTELLKEAYRLSSSLRSHFRCLPAFFRSSALTQRLAQVRYGFHPRMLKNRVGFDSWSLEKMGFRTELG